MCYNQTLNLLIPNLFPNCFSRANSLDHFPYHNRLKAWHVLNRLDHTFYRCKFHLSRTQMFSAWRQQQLQ